MKIRVAQQHDWSQIWEILREAFAAESTYVYSANISEKEAYKLWMEKPTVTFVVQKDNAILGTYYIKPNQPELGSHICNCGYITAKKAQGQGLGKFMCEHSLKMAKDMGFLAMQYNLVVSNNERAVHLWKKFGFEIIGTIPQAFYLKRKQFVDAYIMYKKL